MLQWEGNDEFTHPVAYLNSSAHLNEALGSLPFSSHIKAPRRFSIIGK